ncbi:HD domain-containing protein [Leptolyngbya sp. 7M]|uniref:HD domain-containing protein n=1 Tax=Leptolyngbya sp. 7M TaxID=2812896 RepID=UPI001B8C7C0A|nr:HD domain-containing protein [Leptolyngbya sp. 7M]QYO66396.1 HD domain-containing protein [Leptolyngbya sp. 7M]
MFTSIERIYRDSVHNIIRLKTDTPEGELIAELIDSREFQRLRRIRQLGLAHFAYQGAEHTRFTHSLGAFHLATRILFKLGVSYSVDPADAFAVRIAALLHDIGHGPFSHVVEPILNFHHEAFTIAAIISDETEIGALLREFDKSLPGRVADIIRGNFRPMALAQLVSSQLDVDRMDYLLRDSLMTGAKYGIFDIEWIIKSLEINVEADHLYVSAPGISAVEDYLQARYYMFRQVYFHRTLRSAEAILRSLLKRALELYSEGRDPWFAENTAFESILAGRPLSLREHLSVDDTDMLFHIKRWQSSTDPVLSDLSTRFLNRRLFKGFDLDMPELERAAFVKQAQELVESHGKDPRYYVIEDRAGDVAHNFYIADKGRKKDLIYVEAGFSRPEIREISEVSAAVRGLQEGYRIHRLYFPAEFKDEMQVLYHG